MPDLLKQQGNKQVSEPTSLQLGEVLERFAGDVAEEAIALAEKDGYQTIQEKHIRSALSD